MSRNACFSAIDRASWRGTGIDEDTNAHRLVSFTSVPLEQILQHCICADCAHSLTESTAYALGRPDNLWAVTHLSLSCRLEYIKSTKNEKSLTENSLKSMSSSKTFFRNFGESGQLEQEILGKFLAGNGFCIKKHVAGQTLKIFLAILGNLVNRTAKFSENVEREMDSVLKSVLQKIFESMVTRSTIQFHYIVDHIGTIWKH
ncbi:hypothetical protein T11_14020 [Trichinella zimbabwensis]|uniref:Uncharacterized protein n=1 Tax=Trichinella zimbabwensis TaxID=268475 RepID=A0A0V1GXF0_9BILA|nr:hypothetical protein T11_14020 [Trichinella zimbabwensis]